MPRTVYQFDTQGGGEVVRLFEQIGRAAELTQQRIDRTSRQAGTGVRALDQAVQGLQGSVEGLATTVGGPLGQGLSALSRTGLAGLAIGGVGAIAGVLAIATQRAAEFADRLTDQADALGISVQRYQELIFVGRQFNVNQEQLAAGLTRFARNVGEAERGTGRLFKALEASDPQLLKTIQGTGTLTEKLDAFLTALTHVEDPARKLSLLLAAMGGAGGAGGASLSTFAAALHGGADGLAALSEEAAKTAVNSEQLLRQAARSEEAFHKLEATIKSRLIKGFADLAPYLEATETWLTKLTVAADKFTDAVRGIPDLSGVAPKFTQGQAGDVTKQIADLEKQLQAAIELKNRLGTGAGLAAPSAGGGNTVAIRNNNPGNITASPSTRAYPGVIGEETVGGRTFLRFETTQAGFDAMARLLQGPGYRDLSFDQAMRRWTTGTTLPTLEGGRPAGYDLPAMRGRLGVSGQESMASLTDTQRQALVREMAMREGFGGAGAAGNEQWAAQRRVSVRQTIDDLTKQILALQKVRDGYGETADAAAAAGENQRKAAVEGEASLERYNALVLKLKPALDEINDKEKERLKIIDEAAKAGAAGVAGAPSATEAEHQRERVRAEAAAARDALLAGARKEANALQTYRDSLAATTEATAAFADKQRQLGEGVLPKDIDKTQQITAEGEKLRRKLVEQAQAAGQNTDAANAAADAWIKAKITVSDWEEGIARNTRTLAQNKQQLEASSKFMANLRQEFEESQQPLDSLSRQYAEVTKHITDLKQAAFGTADAMGVVQGAERLAAEEAIKGIEANDRMRISSQNLADELNSAFSTVEQVITDTFEGIILGTRDAGDAFKAMGASMIKTALETVAGIAKSGIIESITGVPQQNSFLDMVKGLFGGVLGGAGGTAPAQAAESMVPTGLFGTPSTMLAKGGSSAVSSGLGQLLPVLGAIAASLAALGFAIKSNISDAASIKAASLGTGQAPANVFKGISIAGSVAGVGAGAGVGAAVGSIFPGIGTAIGAGIGAAVGGAISSAVSQSAAQAIASGITEGVKKGVDQKTIEKLVTEKLSGNMLLNILSLYGGNQLLSALFGGLLTPDIERIFGKMFRQTIGGPGGFDTSMVPVGSTSYYGQKALAPVAGQEGRLIAQMFGAGGEAYGTERERSFASIILGAATARAKKSGEDVAKVVADVFTTAFAGDFLAAVKIAFASPTKLRTGDLAFTAQQFAKSQPTYGFQFGQQAKMIEAEGIVPGTKAVKASRQAFGDAFTAALQDGADSQAFRKSIEGSVQNAFIAGASKALTSGPLGTAFATLFSVSNKRPTFRRRKLRQARRRGDTGAQVEILSTEFQHDVADFAKLVSDPAFANAIQAFNDQLLRLQVEAAVAAGDTKTAADAIEAHLLPAIQAVKDIAQLQRDVRSRSALAEAGPGFAGDQANVAELTRQRQDVEQQFRARMGGAGIEDFGRLLRGEFTRDWGAFRDRMLVVADEALRTGDPADLLQQFREFADARLSELEGELSLLRSLKDAFQEAKDAFRGMQDQAEEALGTADTGARTKELVDKAWSTAIENWNTAFDPKGHPEKLADITTALGLAISAAASRLQFYQAASTQAQGLSEQAGVARGGRTAQANILAQRLAELGPQLGTALGGGAGADTATTKALALLGETIAGVTQKLEFFKAAIEAFTSLAEQTDTILRGLDAQSAQLTKRTAEIATLLPKALAGGNEAADAFEKIQKDLGEAVQIASAQLSFFKGAGDTFESFASQVDIAQRGKRGAREQLGGVQADIAQQLPKALAGSTQALEELQKLLPQALQLGQQAYSGGRARSFEAGLEAIARELEAEARRRQADAEAQLESLGGIASHLSTAAGTQATDADKQLGQLQKNADDLQTTADARSDEARAQLKALDWLAKTAGIAAGAGLSTTDTLLLAATAELEAFVADIQPVLTYLSSKAQTTLHDDFNHIAQLLGDDPNSPLLKILNDVKARLPQPRAAGGPVLGGQTYLVGESGREWFTAPSSGNISPTAPAAAASITYQITGPLVVFQNAPRSQAEADEYGRTLGDAFERRVQSFQARQRGMRKVA